MKLSLIGTFGFGLAVALVLPATTFAMFDTLDARLLDKPTSVTVEESGSFSGLTEEGTIYRQYQIVTDRSVRIQKFVLGDIAFYISDKGVFSAEDDLRAISIYFSLV